MYMNMYRQCHEIKTNITSTFETQKYQGPETTS